ncbi:MAG: hypothetical protein QME51_10580 [Planctomycetota bacterium]|nr:hypothetical protein [Planctomycetota bacterium]
MFSVEERNWLDEKFTYIITKIDVIKDDLADQKRLLALTEAAHKTLYARVEEHDLEPCNNIEKHCGEYHKGLTTGKLIAAISAIVAILGAVIAITLSLTGK